MARLVGPDDASRLAYRIRAVDRVLQDAAGLTATVYTSQAATTLANILTVGGSAIANSQLTVGADSLIPLFQFPDGVDTVYVKVGTGAAYPLYARTDDRLDALGGGSVGDFLQTSLNLSDVPDKAAARTNLGVTGGGGGGGSFATYTVAANDAPADDKAAADYLCDGTADNVQIQQAIDAAQTAGGGVVQLSQGNFTLAAAVTINGTVDEDNPKTVTLAGCGEFATYLRPAANVNGVAISNWAQCHLSGFAVVVSGSGSGIVSTAVTTTDTRSFWCSSLRNLRINGGYVTTNTGWGMDLAMPFRSVFENIEIEGTRNGMRLSNEGTVQNAGDSTFTRMFIEIVGTNGVAIHVSSPSNNMNQNNFNMIEAGASGTGCTGILIDGAGGGASQRFWGTNLEQFATLVNVAHGESNVFDLNYVTCKDGAAGNKAFVCGTQAYNNRFSAMWVNVASAGTLALIEDNNSIDTVPNYFENIRIENNTGGNVTYTIADTAILRNIVAFNAGTIQAGLLKLPQSTPDPKNLTTTVTTTSTVLVDLGSTLQYWVHPGTYTIELSGFVQTSATTAFPKFAMGGTATWGTGSSASIMVGTSATAVHYTRTTAVNGESANPSIAAATTDVPVTIRGTIVITAAGTLRPRWRAAAAGTLTLQPGANFTIRKSA